MSDYTLDRLRELTSRLTECLWEAEEIRARFTKARHEANAWPDLRSASRRFIDAEEHADVHPSDDGSRTH